MSARAAAAALLLGGTLAGCVLVASSSSDYTATDGGSLACLSAQDCPSGEAGAQVCCLTGDLRSPTACQASCAPVQPQLCSGNNECGDAACVPQSCFSRAFLACGVVSCPTLDAGR